MNKPRKPKLKYPDEMDNLQIYVTTQKFLKKAFHDSKSYFLEKTGQELTYEIFVNHLEIDYYSDESENCVVEYSLVFPLKKDKDTIDAEREKTENRYKKALNKYLKRMKSYEEIE